MSPKDISEHLVSPTIMKIYNLRTLARSNWKYWVQDTSRQVASISELHCKWM